MKNRAILLLFFHSCLGVAHSAETSATDAYTSFSGRWSNSDGQGQALSLTRKSGEWKMTHWAINKGCSFEDKRADVIFDGDSFAFAIVEPMPCGTLYKGSFKQTTPGVYEGEIAIDFSPKYPLLKAKLNANPLYDTGTTYPTPQSGSWSTTNPTYDTGTTYPVDKQNPPK